MNTVVFGDGRAIGHNTDGPGSRRGFTAGSRTPRSIAWSLLGAGGAGAAVAQALLTLGAQRLTIVDVEPERAAELAPTLTRFGAGRVDAAPIDELEARLQPPTGWSTPPRPAWRRIPGLPLPPELLHPGFGWPRSSTARWRPSCCARPRGSAAARWMAAAWRSSRPPRRSSSSPASRPTAERMLRHFAALVARDVPDAVRR